MIFKMLNNEQYSKTSNVTFTNNRVDIAKIENYENKTTTLALNGTYEELDELIKCILGCFIYINIAPR